MTRSVRQTSVRGGEAVQAPKKDGVRLATGPAQARRAAARDKDGELPLPHERDQSSDGVTSPEPDPRIKQAQQDIESGQVDTDLRNTPGLDAPRRRQLIDDKGKGKDKEGKKA